MTAAPTTTDESFAHNWTAEILKTSPMIAPARQFTYPQQIAGEEDAWGSQGLAWESARLSWEGVRVTGIEDNILHGVGWNLLTDKEVPFTLNLLTGHHQGGGFIQQGSAQQAPAQPETHKS
jgi:hypothetical protein